MDATLERATEGIIAYLRQHARYPSLGTVESAGMLDHDQQRNLLLDTG